MGPRGVFKGNISRKHNVFSRAGRSVWGADFNLLSLISVSAHALENSNAATFAGFKGKLSRKRTTWDGLDHPGVVMARAILILALLVASAAARNLVQDEPAVTPVGTPMTEATTAAHVVAEPDVPQVTPSSTIANMEPVSAVSVPTGELSRAGWQAVAHTLFHMHHVTPSTHPQRACAVAAQARLPPHSRMLSMCG
jgi:hypothetical protein